MLRGGSHFKPKSVKVYFRSKTFLIKVSSAVSCLLIKNLTGPKKIKLANNFFDKSKFQTNNEPENDGGNSKLKASFSDLFVNYL